MVGRVDSLARDLEEDSRVMVMRMVSACFSYCDQRGGGILQGCLLFHSLANSPRITRVVDTYGTRNLHALHVLYHFHEINHQLLRCKRSSNVRETEEGRQRTNTAYTNDH